MVIKRMKRNCEEEDGSDGNSEGGNIADEGFQLKCKY